MNASRRPSLFSPWDLLGPLAFGALWGFYHRILPTLPDPVPTHWNAQGTINGWTAKAGLPWFIFGLPILVWAIVTALAVLFSALREDPDRARAAAMQPVRGLLGAGLACLTGSTLLAPSRGPGVALIGAGILIFLVSAGIALQVRDYARTPAGAQDRERYRWGVVYVNPEDPRIWVEKRVGIGWTLNFGRPASWLFLILILSPIAILAVVAAQAH